MQFFFRIMHIRGPVLTVLQGIESFLFSKATTHMKRYWHLALKTFLSFYHYLLTLDFQHTSIWKNVPSSEEPTLRSMK